MTDSGADNPFLQTKPYPSWQSQWLLLATVAVVALVVRLWVVWEVVRVGGTAAPDHSDARQYVSLAHGLVNSHRYGGSGAEARYMALLRPPGYPMFCALALVVGHGDERAILWAQAVVMSVLPVLVAALARRVFAPSVVPAWLAGLTAAISPTGVGCCGTAVADGLLALLLLGGFLCLYDGATSDRPGRTFAASLLFAAALLVKPVMLYWPVLSLILHALLAGGALRPIAWRRTSLLLFTVPALTVGGWCIHNDQREGTFAFSTIDAQNLRYFIAPDLEARAAPREDASYYARRRRVESRDQRALASGRQTPASLAAMHRHESWLVVKRLWRYLPGTLWKNCRDAITAGWDLFETEIPRDTSARRFLVTTARFAAAKAIFYITCVLAGISLLGPLLLPSADRQRRRMLHRVSMVMLITFLFFAITASTSLATGSRIMYPVQFTILMGSLAGLAIISDWIDLLSRSISFTSGSASR